MSSLLDDVNVLLKAKQGDLGRLEHIKKTLEENKQLYVSDRLYLTDLSKKYLENETEQTRQVKSSLNYSEKSDDMLYSENENMIGHDELDSNTSTKQENKIFCNNCGTQMLESAQFCNNCGKSSNATLQTNVPNYQVIRNRDSKRARNCLILGILVTLIWIIFSVSLSGTSEIDDMLSEFPEQIQSIKRGQILNCENNMGYLQSFKLGEMIKDRCINSVLGK